MAKYKPSKMAERIGAGTAYLVQLFIALLACGGIVWAVKWIARMIGY